MSVHNTRRWQNRIWLFLEAKNDWLVNRHIPLVRVSFDVNLYFPDSIIIGIILIILLRIIIILSFFLLLSFLFCSSIFSFSLFVIVLSTQSVVKSLSIFL